MKEIKDLQEKISKLERELIETKDQSQKYMQNVAHQLTAPLGAIKWSIEALLNDSVPLQRKKTLLSSIYNQATILVHLIKNFALMSNLEADHELGQFREKPDGVDMMKLAINLSNDFQPQALDKDMRILVNDHSFKSTIGKNKLLIEKNFGKPSNLKYY